MAIRKPKFKVNKVREFVFNNNPYHIVWKNKLFKGGHYAECDPPDSTSVRKEIRIAPKNLKDQKFLLHVLIDEVVHTHWFMLDNNDVCKFSEELADFLWEIGYRLPIVESKPARKTD